MYTYTNIITSFNFWNENYRAQPIDLYTKIHIKLNQESKPMLVDNTTNLLETTIMPKVSTRRIESSSNTRDYIFLNGTNLGSNQS